VALKHLWDGTTQQDGLLLPYEFISSLDDFEASYPAFIYFIKFPVNVIKIDQSLIKGIVKAIINMAHGFSGMEVLSKGIEKISTLAVLNGMHSGHYQGYLFSEALNSLGKNKILYLMQNKK